MPPFAARNQLASFMVHAKRCQRIVGTFFRLPTPPPPRAPVLRRCACGKVVPRKSNPALRSDASARARTGPGALRQTKRTATPQHRLLSNRKGAVVCGHPAGRCVSYPRTLSGRPPPILRPVRATPLARAARACPGPSLRHVANWHARVSSEAS